MQLRCLSHQLDRWPFVIRILLYLQVTNTTKYTFFLTDSLRFIAFSMGVVLALEFNFLETIEINRTVLELLYLRALAEGMDFELVRSTLTSVSRD